MDLVWCYQPPKHLQVYLSLEMNLISIEASQASRSFVKVKEIRFCSGKFFFSPQKKFMVNRRPPYSRFRPTNWWYVLSCQHESDYAAPWLQISRQRPEQADSRGGEVWLGRRLQRCHPWKSGTTSNPRMKQFAKWNGFLQTRPSHRSAVQGILLDEADGVNRNQKPVMPAGFQPPKIVVSSWNRKVK